MKKLVSSAAILAIFINSFLGVLSQLPITYAQETIPVSTTQEEPTKDSTADQSVSSPNSDQYEVASSSTAQLAEVAQEAVPQSPSNGIENGQVNNDLENSSDRALNSSPIVNVEPETQEVQQDTSANPLETIINEVKRFLTTDKNDYSPDSTVKITGAGFEPNQTFKVRMTWPDGTIRGSGNRIGETDWVTTDSSGNLYFDYQLTAGQNGAYKAEVLNEAGQVLATAFFTDNNHEEDFTPPQSTFTSPEDGSFWGINGIDIAGSSTDVPQETVDYVTLWVSFTGEEDWFEIAQIGNEDEDEPFHWSFTWFPEEEGIYDILAEATDKAGNVEGSPVVEEVTYDITPPESEITSPGDNSLWKIPIPVEGNSLDNFAVDYARLFYRTSGEEEEENPWTEIDTNPDENGIQPLVNEDYGRFYWQFDWIPPEEGTFDIKAEATDKSGNVELSPVVEYVTYDVTSPTSDISYPGEGQRYIEDVWNGEIRGTSSDSPSSGVATVLVSIQRDSDGLYWNEGGWSESEDNGEILNEDVDFNEKDGTWNFAFDFIEPEGADDGYTVRSHALDNAGNLEATNTVHFFFGRAPLISDEEAASVSSSSVTVSWTTDFAATSRVVYDTVSHLALGEAPNYGYANSTVESNLDPKVTSHSQTIDGLTAGTTYYYRTVSRGSPEAVGGEKTFTTKSALSAAPSSPSFSSPGPASPPSCNDPKPGSAPTLLSAQAGTNEVTLTWSEAQDPVTYYLITYGTAPGAQSFGNPNVGGKGTTSYTVFGLSGGVTYYFKVRAGNGCAPGDFSNELSKTPGGVFVQGPAAGFTPGILGTETLKETPSVQAPPVAPSALGTASEVKGERNWANIVTIILGILAGAGVIFWLFRRGFEKLEIS